MEDSLLLQRQILAALEENGGLRVTGTAVSVAHAIHEVPALRPDILVLDLQFEDGSGWDVWDTVGAYAGETVILTNHHSAPFRQAAQERNIRFFFDKTAEFEEFVTCLQSLVAVG